MTMLGWFLMAIFALVASVALWWAERLQQENTRLWKKVCRLERERDEEPRYVHQTLRGLSREDRATILQFPENRRSKA